MGCASGKPASRSANNQSSPQKGQNPTPVQKPHPYDPITIEIQNKDSKTGSNMPSQQLSAPENITIPSVSAGAHDLRSTPKTGAGINKENKEESKKQLLKKYEIKVNNNSQRVLPVNSYRYDILLPHNPQIAQGEVQINTVSVAQRE